jgi:arsenate reductase
MTETRKLKVLFLCTGNAVRSQMAEGLARQLLGGRVEPYSAGIEPRGLDPRAVRVMQEAGMDISQQRSKHVDECRDTKFDLVVTVCDYAKEQCPLFLGPARKIHRSFKDPAKAEGADTEVMAVFRRVRDEIKGFVKQLPGQFSD